MIDNLSDEEIIETISEHLTEDGRVNTDYIKIECHDTRPVISGRVASDEQIQIVDEILTDVLEVESFENNLWVDDALAFESSADEEEDEDKEEEMDEEEEFDGDEEEEEF